MILQRLSQREKLLLFSTLGILLAAGMYGLMLEPLVSKWKSLNEEIVQKTILLNKNLRTLQKEKPIREEFEKYSQHTGFEGTDEETIASLLKVIEEKASATSTYITNIRPRPIRETPFYKEFIFEVIAESSLDQLAKFIFELQNSKELLKVRRMTLTMKSSKRQALKGVMEISKISVTSTTPR